MLINKLLLINIQRKAGIGKRFVTAIAQFHINHTHEDIGVGRKCHNLNILIIFVEIYVLKPYYE